MEKDLEHLEKLAGNARRFVEGGQTELAAWTLRNLAQVSHKLLELVEKDVLAEELSELTGSEGFTDITDPEEHPVDRG